MFECKECYNTHGAGLNTIAFCEGCKLTVGDINVEITYIVHKYLYLSIMDF